MININRSCTYLVWIFFLLNFLCYRSVYSQDNHVHKESNSNISNDSLKLLNQQFDQEWNKWRDSLFELDINKNMLIGEIGAGNGEFSFLLSMRVGPKGHVYANEVDQSKIHIIKDLIRENSINNMSVLSGAEDDALFPVDNLDMALMVEVYHHISNPNTFFNNLIKYFAKNGQIVIIDPDVHQPGGSLDGCYSDPDSTKSLLAKLGYSNVRINYKNISDLKLYVLSANCPMTE